MGELKKRNSDHNVKEKIKKEKKNWGKNKMILFAVIVFILIASICVIGYFYINKNYPQIIEFEEDEVMRVNNQKVVMNEFLLYAADVYQGYDLQNEADWDSVITDSLNNIITYEEQVKGTICEQIRMTKVLCMESKNEGVSLSGDEKEILIDNAQTYYSNLTSANVIDEELTVFLIAKFYEENALAQKVYNSIIEGYDENQNPSTKENYDVENKELSEKELYFIDVYHNLADKYDKIYDYSTSINWDLLEQISFSEISNKDSTETDKTDSSSK